MMIPKYRVQQLFHDLDEAASQWAALGDYSAAEDNVLFDLVDKNLAQVKEDLIIETSLAECLSYDAFDKMIDMTKENGYIDHMLDQCYDHLVIDNGSLQRFHEFVDTWTRIQQNFKFITQSR